MTVNVLDLDAAREARARARAEQTGPVELRFGGEVIAELPPELPVDVLEPLMNVDLDLAALAREALGAMNSSDADAQRKAVELFVDLIVANPKLPQDLIDAVREMGRLLLTEDGYARFVAKRPSLQDVAALVKGLAERYASLGESLRSSTPAADGTTSKPILPATTTDSTSEPSGDSQEAPAGSVPAGSPS
jgi:hypothetical protein